MSYDNWSWHAGGDYPEDLPEENGATHIGVFLAWAFHQGLEGELHQQDSADDLAKIRAHEMTGREFLMEMCDGKFTSEDLNDEGNAFVEAYYDKGYFNDYDEAIDTSSLKSTYHAEDSRENFKKVAAMLDQRFQEWKSGSLTVNVTKRDRPWWKFWA